MGEPVKLITVMMTCLTTTLYCMFAECSGLTSVTLPDSLTHLGQCAFDDDVKLGPLTHPLLAESSEGETDNSEGETDLSW